MAGTTQWVIGYRLLSCLHSSSRRENKHNKASVLLIIVLRNVLLHNAYVVFTIARETYQNYVPN